ncbi:FbpB family small basic protein [Metabacillus herbersteinensis]|uniref:FbpB family small basic protein n=1 Tax=Metabacillus herbersteinensis TaxID=283816 RepID=A0ABV6GJZ5_9BACI
MRKKIPFKDLMKMNKQNLLNDKKAMERISDKIDERELSRSYKEYSRKS